MRIKDLIVMKSFKQTIYNKIDINFFNIVKIQYFN